MSLSWLYCVQIKLTVHLQKAHLQSMHYSGTGPSITERGWSWRCTECRRAAPSRPGTQRWPSSVPQDHLRSGQMSIISKGSVNHRNIVKIVCSCELLTWINKFWIVQLLFMLSRRSASDPRGRQPGYSIITPDIVLLFRSPRASTRTTSTTTAPSCARPVPRARGPGHTPSGCLQWRWVYKSLEQYGTRHRVWGSQRQWITLT